MIKTMFDEYFYPILYIEDVVIQENHVGISGYRPQDREYFFRPLYNSISGLSPSGLNYRELGRSCHESDINTIGEFLLNN